jgi:hypothetical protein
MVVLPVVRRNSIQPNLRAQVSAPRQSHASCRRPWRRIPFWLGPGGTRPLAKRLSIAHLQPFVRLLFPCLFHSTVFSVLRKSSRGIRPAIPSSSSQSELRPRTGAVWFSAMSPRKCRERLRQGRRDIASGSFWDNSHLRTPSQIAIYHISKRFMRCEPRRACIGRRIKQFVRPPKGRCCG